MILPQLLLNFLEMAVRFFHHLHMSVFFVVAVGGCLSQRSCLNTFLLFLWSHFKQPLLLVMRSFISHDTMHFY